MADHPISKPDPEAVREAGRKHLEDLKREVRQKIEMVGRACDQSIVELNDETQDRLHEAEEQYHENLREGRAHLTEAAEQMREAGKKVNLLLAKLKAARQEYNRAVVHFEAVHEVEKDERKRLKKTFEAAQSAIKNDAREKEIMLARDVQQERREGAQKILAAQSDIRNDIWSERLRLWTYNLKSIFGLHESAESEDQNSGLSRQNDQKQADQKPDLTDGQGPQQSLG